MGAIVGIIVLNLPLSLHFRTGKTMIPDTCNCIQPVLSPVVPGMYVVRVFVVAYIYIIHVLVYLLAPSLRLD